MEPKVDCAFAVVTEQASRIRPDNQQPIRFFMMSPLKIAISPIMGDDRTHVNAKQILWAATLGGEPACP